MADLCGNNIPSHSLESEEMSSFLHNLLHNSSSTTSSAFTSFKSQHIHSFSSPPPPSAARIIPASESFHRFAEIPSDSNCHINEGEQTAVVDTSPTYNFSDPSRCFPTNTKESSRSIFSDAITSTMKESEVPAEIKFDNIGFGCEGGEVSEVPVKTVRSCSSKRSRASEVHNLSEKRRRSRINEKLKALQNLVPNSNKTDKASMLDEAIEYLKQLQLQVQMLTMRNGLGLHPVYLPGSQPPIQLPESGMDFDAGNGLVNTNSTAHTFSGNQEISLRTAFDIFNHTPPNQPVVTNSETLIGLEPPIPNHYGFFNHLTSSKDICRNDTSSLLQLDMSCSGKKLSPGVSS